MGGRVTTSIVMPVFNSARHLEAAFGSILAQTRQDFEVIVVDDGSTDNSLDLIDRQAAADGRFRKVVQEHAMQGAARNRGLSLARGEYVYFMDADDVIEPDLLERCVDACERDALDFCTFDSFGFDDDPGQPFDHVPPEIADRSDLVEDRVWEGSDYWTTYWNDHGITFVCWQYLIRRSFLEENRIAFDEGTYFEDNAWTLKLFLAARRMRYLPLVLHGYRVHSQSTVHGSFSAELAKSCLRVHLGLLSMLEQDRDPNRTRMVENVLRMSLFRLDRLADTCDEKRCVRETSDFVRLLERRADESVPGVVLDVTMATIAHVLAATRSWQAPVALDLSCAPASAPYRMLEPGGRVGVYGMGVVGTRFMTLFEPLAEALGIKVVFIDTTAATGGIHDGRLVANVRDAGGLGLLGVVVASVGYASDMRRAAREHLGDDIPLWSVNRFIDFYA